MNLRRITLSIISARFPIKILKNVATNTAEVIKIPMFSTERPLSFKYSGIKGQDKEKLTDNKNRINVIA